MLLLRTVMATDVRGGAHVLYIKVMDMAELVFAPCRMTTRQTMFTASGQQPDDRV